MNENIKHVNLYNEMLKKIQTINYIRNFSAVAKRFGRNSDATQFLVDEVIANNAYFNDLESLKKIYG